jgi:hypothetical protein
MSDDDSDVRADIIEGIATILWATNLANHVDEHRCCDLSGCEITQVMPSIPDVVRAHASHVATRVEEASGSTIEVLYSAAVAADEAAGTEAPANRSGPARFGECLAYESAGHGVSWTDDHEEVPGLVVPYVDDYKVRDVADEECDAEECANPRELQRMCVRVPNWCGHYVKGGRHSCQECGAALHWRSPREVRAADGPCARAFLRKLAGGRWGREGSKRWHKAERRLWRLLDHAPGE